MGGRGNWRYCAGLSQQGSLVGMKLQIRWWVSRLLCKEAKRATRSDDAGMFKPTCAPRHQRN